MGKLDDLPPELLREVLVFCDTKSLSACCITSKAILEIAEDLIFETIDTTKRKPLLTNILKQEFKHIDLVRHLRVTFSAFEEGEFLRLVEILSTARALVSLHLQISPSQFCSLNNSLQNFDLPLPFTIHGSSTVDVIGQESGAVIPWEVDCPCVDDISVGDDGELGDNVLQRSTSKRIKPVLTTLRLEHYPAPWSSLEQHFDVSRLRRLSLWIPRNSASIESIHDGMCAVSPSLEILSIFYITEHSFPSNLPHHFPRLRSVLIWTCEYPYPWRTWLIPIVTNFDNHCPNLRTLSIYTHIPPDKNDDGYEIQPFFEDTLFSKDKDEFNDLLDHIASSKRLTRLELWFWENDDRITDVHENGYRRLEKEIRVVLSASGFRGIVNVHWQVNWSDNWPFHEDSLGKTPF